ATGKTNAEISEYLGVSVATTKTHINRIYSKLEVRNRTQALLKAEEQHIL
ncbi:MAG: LuxR C-terminal-related transcriptional regulator, partial [Eubacterium sp.]